MGSKTLVYKQKVLDNLEESHKHLTRLEIAFNELGKHYQFPLAKDTFKKLTKNNQMLAFSDQCIYRFSKLQDCMGAKLFRSVLMYQGENTNKPFLDILNQLERVDVLNVDEWFEIRDIRNEIAHDYDGNDTTALHMLNAIYRLKDELKDILDAINSLLH